MFRKDLVLRAARLASCLLVLMLLALPQVTAAQEVAEPPSVADSTAADVYNSYPNNIAGEFTPAKGFDIIKTKHASLNISLYGMFRYLNQLPAEQTYTDHLGREQTVRARNDLNWHRTMLWITGFLGTPQFRYNVTFWSLASTQQTLGFGNLSYTFNRHVTLGAGMAPNITNRSMQGSFPYWAAMDRHMTEEFLRGGFASGAFLRGELVSRLHYIASVNTNLSQLGVTASNDSRDVAVSGSLTWMPTTGEFGPRGGFGDLEHHETVATRFGVSTAHAREDRAAPLGSPPGETQLRLSDGLLLFAEGSLADGVTLKQADYDVIATDAAFKYRGFCFQGEYFARRLSKFDATGPVPLDSIVDQGVMAAAMHMVVPKKLGLYLSGGYVWDEFERNPWEVSGGADFYPLGERTWRINVHVIRIDKSPASSNFGYYTAGQKGTTLSLATDIIL